MNHISNITKKFTSIADVQDFRMYDVGLDCKFAKHQFSSTVANGCGGCSGVTANAR